MNVYVIGTTLTIGQADVCLAHLTGAQRQSVIEAIHAESDAAERDADTAAAERADEAWKEGSDDMRMRVNDLLKRLLRDAPDDEAVQTLECFRSEMESI